jgi:hypothetical protein
VFPLLRVDRPFVQALLLDKTKLRHSKGMLDLMMLFLSSFPADTMTFGRSTGLTLPLAVWQEPQPQFSVLQPG